MKNTTQLIMVGNYIPLIWVNNALIRVMGEQRMIVLMKKHNKVAYESSEDSDQPCFRLLTHLCLPGIEILAITNRMNPFQILGLLGSILQIHSNFKWTFCKQTVQNLIKSILFGV